MDVDKFIGRFGSPDIEIGTLYFWIHNRQFPDAKDFWDGNWVNTTVYCSAKGANVWVEGPILHLSELKKWTDDCQKMYDSLSGGAELNCMEPHLYIKMSIDKTGQIEMQVDITADNLCQMHKFKFSIDQSYLPRMIGKSKEVLDKFPLREEAHS
jgi:hypothetical protein